MVPGEPAFREGAAVRVARGFQHWEGMERFRGLVGVLSRRERALGWHVAFPDIKEEVRLAHFLAPSPSPEPLTL